VLDYRIGAFTHTFTRHKKQIWKPNEEDSTKNWSSGRRI